MLCWRPSLEVGVPEVDAQHRVLFERAASFEAAVAGRAVDCRLEELFAYLVHYAVVHFEAEERLMREIGYPRRAEHAKEHSDFQQTLQSLMPRWVAEGDSPPLLTSVLAFLDYWLNAHVQSSDRRIGEFLRARNQDVTVGAPPTIARVDPSSGPSSPGQAKASGAGRPG
jgi:hemerythrin